MKQAVLISGKYLNRYRRHFVTEIIPDSQADKVGLNDGWKIAEVNG